MHDNFAGSYFDLESAQIYNHVFVNCLVIVRRNAGVLAIKLHASSSRPFCEKFCQLHVSVGGCDSVTGKKRQRTITDY